MILRKVSIPKLVFISKIKIPATRATKIIKRIVYNNAFTFILDFI